MTINPLKSPLKGQYRIILFTGNGWGSSTDPDKAVAELILNELPECDAYIFVEDATGWKRYWVINAKVVICQDISGEVSYRYRVST